MRIIRIINQNKEKIKYLILIAIFSIFIISFSNRFYREKSIAKKEELIEKEKKEQIEENIVKKEEDYKVENSEIDETIEAFVHFCNTKNVEKAYNMLTNECKEKMFRTKENFQKMYLDIIYTDKKTFKLLKMDQYKNYEIYEVTLYGDILSTGDSQNYKKEYITFVKDESGKYKLNINNYLFTENKNYKQSLNGVEINVVSSDIYEEYEVVELEVTNNTNSDICLFENNKNTIYLENREDVKYRGMNAMELVVRSGASKKIRIQMNKMFSGVRKKATSININDIILNYLPNSENLNKFDMKIRY